MKKLLHTKTNLKFGQRGEIDGITQAEKELGSTRSLVVYGKSKHDGALLFDG
jgi:hypothetical protein